MTGFVYAIADSNGRIKIGWSRNPQKRRDNIATANPGVWLVGQVAATKQDEQELHKLLKSERIAGEWFHFRGIVKTFTEMLSLPPPPERQIPDDACALKAWRIKNGIRLADLADEIGTTHTSLSRIENGRQTPSVTLLRKLSSRTGLSIDALLGAGAVA